MAKTIGSVLNTFYGPLSGLVIKGGDGFKQGLMNAGAALGGPTTYAAYVAGSAITAATAPGARSETTLASLRTERPARVSAYGAMKRAGALIL
ncbi:hypothetical protein [Sphingomonas phyllosphaerae]|uniref:hypothetical protein n=1 Tax=Sphingomonas phyllosphaerae TaxID=257003 RepID=UPI0003B4523A|nr:hypothetical protein [Sphingomonas phyllosphaerae]